MSKEFTIRNLKNLGLEHTPSLDFHDDGTNFKMFSYNGLPVCYTKVDGDYYLSIRFDCAEGSPRYDTYKDFPSYKVADEFNGVSEIDEEKLAENLEACWEDMYNWQVENRI